MNIFKKLTLLILFLVVTGCASVGQKLVIETPEPAEDILVLCDKSVDYLVGHNASSHSVVDKVFVVKSGELVDCGIVFFDKAGTVRITHPIYVGDGTKNYDVDGVRHIVLNKTKLNLLEEQKTKFEAGYWGKYSFPDKEYARSFGGCGFGYQYLDYYSGVKSVDKMYFFNKYNNFFLRCNTEIYKEVLKHDSEIANRSFNVEKSMESIWNKDKLRKYEK